MEKKYLKKSKKMKIKKTLKSKNQKLNDICDFVNLHF